MRELSAASFPRGGRCTVAMLLLVAATATAADSVAVGESSVVALLAKDEWREALVVARDRHARFPADPHARSALGEALYRAGLFEEGESILAPLAAVESAPGRGLVTLGLLRDAQGRHGEAVELMRRAVEAAPTDRHVLYRAADAAASRTEAIERLERYLEFGDGDRAERIEAAEGTIRLFRALGERPVWVSEARPEHLEIPLRPVWDPYTGQTAAWVIRVRLGPKGKPVPLLLDSGSPGLFVIERAARKRGFEPLAETTVFGGGGDGRHATQRGFFPEVSIGGLTFRDALATVARQELDPTGRYLGLIGLSVFNGYHVTLDFKRKRLILDQKTSAEQGSPYYSVGGQMLVRAEADAGRSGLFLFDTGATHTLVADAFVEGYAGARSAGPAEVSAFGGLRENVRVLEGFEVRFQHASTAGRPIRAVDLGLRSAVGGVEIAGFLGLDVLGGQRIEIDTVARRVRLGESGKR